MPLCSPPTTNRSSDSSTDKDQPSETSALPITNAAVAPAAWFLRLPLEIRELVYSYLINHYPKDHGSNMKFSPAGNIIFRRNSFHSAILRTDCQIREEALRVFYRETVWYIRIPGASILPRSPYWAFQSWKSFQKHPFFKFIRHIMLDFERPHMHNDSLMIANRRFALHGRVRGFEYTTDVLPRRSAVEHVVNALVHLPALKTVSIEWNDIAGWGDLDEKCLCLRPLEKLPVRCVVESVNFAFPPTVTSDFLQSWLLEQACETWQDGSWFGLFEHSQRGLEKLGNYLTGITRK